MLPFGQFRFEVVRVVGEGGLGIVEEIRVTESNCSYQVGARFACKRLNSNWKNQPTAKERFEREIVAISRMDHTAIIPFRGQNLPGEERFYVMPLYPQSLRDFIKANRAGAEWRSVARFGATVAEALHHAHLMGYIHRDLKPENILLDHNQRPIVSDWGLGYFIHQDSKVLDLTRGGMGTIYYCSMEQWSTGKCDERGDIYSLGIVLAELVRGFDRINVIPGTGLGNANAVVDNAAGSYEFNIYLRKMTLVRKEDRPRNMLDVKSELLRIANTNSRVA